jgi:hypothetical protein
VSPDKISACMTIPTCLANDARGVEYPAGLRFGERKRNRLSSMSRRASSYPGSQSCSSLDRFRSLRMKLSLHMTIFISSTSI